MLLCAFSHSNTMKLFALLLCTLAVTLASKARYDDYTVFRVIPSNFKQVAALQDLQNANGVFSFWNDVTAVGKPVDIMVPPQERDDFVDNLRRNYFNFDVMIDDVQKKIDEQEASVKATTTFGWTGYHTLDEIYDWLYQMEKEHPGIVKVVKGGSSYEGRDILGAHISFGPGKENRTVFIEGGIHAREWISPATVTYIMNEILTSQDPIVQQIATSHDWYIFPSFNPDGYVFTFAKNRLWRKTRSPHGICYGVDANRNWGYHWMEGGASSIPCIETYAGPEAFSEIETRSMADFINTIGSQIETFLSFHSYSQLLLIPYGHSSEHVQNYDELYEVGVMAAKNLEKRYGTKYTVGNIVETIYIASGGSMDWVKGNHNTRVTYTYELRDTGRHGFLLPPEQIIPTAEETMDSIITIMTEFDKRQ